jgi:hypothetical protein
MFDVSFIVHQAGMDTALLLLLGFDHHSPRASVCLFRSVYDPSLRKFVAACFGLGDATVFGPFRKNDDQSNTSLLTLCAEPLARCCMVISIRLYTSVHLAVFLLAATAAQLPDRVVLVMAVRKKPAAQAVLPVGLVGSGLVGVAPPPALAPAPDEAVPATKDKTKWKDTRQGRKKLARAIDNKATKNEGNMSFIGAWPFGAHTEIVNEKDSPLHELRQAPTWQVCRMAMFLLQMVMNLAKTYTPSPGLEYRFGSGLRTAPRIALLMLHEVSVHDAWKKQLCRKRNFWLRALYEGESLKAFMGGEVISDPDQEWKVHLHEDTREKCRQLIEAHAEHYIKEGRISKVDNTKAYENMMSHASWEAGLIYALHAGCFFGGSSVHSCMYSSMLKCPCRGSEVGLEWG